MMFLVSTLQSFHFCKYRRDENQLYIFADDSVPRWLTASYHVDFDTMAGADKFGNIYFVRLPQDVSDEIEEDPTGGKIKWEQGKLNGAPNKVEEIVQFHIGDVVNSLQKASLIPGGGECIMYGTVMGSVGALLPFTSRDDVDFFSHLEMHLRQDHPPLCGRDHMAYRSAYFPVKVSHYRWFHLIIVSQHQFKMLLKPLSCFKQEQFIACTYFSQ
jgi:splicing factor 3B subunit 3